MITSIKKKLGYASYDFSNSGYVAVFQSFLFPLVIVEMLTTKVVNAEMYWAVVVAFSSILAIITAPYVGRYSDTRGKFTVFKALVISLSLLLIFAIPLLAHNVFFLLVTFIIFNWFFELSQSIYDAFLVDLSTSPRETSDLSSFAWGFGYLGGASFAVIYFFLNHFEFENISMLAIFGVLFFVSTLPAFRFLSKIQTGAPNNVNPSEKISLLKIKSPLPYSHLFVYAIIANTVTTILYFAPLYLKTDLKLSTMEIGGILLIGQLVAFPATILISKLSHKLTRIKTIQITLLIWALGLFGLFIASTIVHVILVFLLLSLVVGSTQALVRAHFADSLDVSSAAEGFGFYAIAQKSASVIAPLLVLLVILIGGSLNSVFLLLFLLILCALALTQKLNSNTI